MRSATRRAIRIFAAIVKVSTDFATVDFGISNECDHDMSNLRRQHAIGGRSCPQWSMCAPSVLAPQVDFKFSGAFSPDKPLGLTPQHSLRLEHE